VTSLETYDRVDIKDSLSRWFLAPGEHRSQPTEEPAVLKDLLRTTDLSARDLIDLVDLAAALGSGGLGAAARGPRVGVAPPLAGELVVVFLTEPAPEIERTFAAAADLLGAGVVVLGPDEFQRGCGATVDDVARAVSLYAAAVVAGTDDIDVRRLAAAATVPVVDGRDRGDDPCSRLAEVLTRQDRCPSLERPWVVGGIDGLGGLGVVDGLGGDDVVDVTGRGDPGPLGHHGPGPEIDPADSARLAAVVDLADFARLTEGRGVLYGPTGSAVLTAVDRRVATPVCPCGVGSVARRAEHRVHAAAAVLLALHRRQLTGAGA
jgi:hypothetical protein